MDYLQTMPFYYKLLAVSVAVIVVAVILYFVPGGRIRIPAIFFCALACLLAGIGVGVIGMSYFGYHWEREPTPKIAGSPFSKGGGAPGDGGSQKGGDGASKKEAGKKENDKKGSSVDDKKGSEKKSKDDDS